MAGLALGLGRGEPGLDLGEPGHGRAALLLRLEALGVEDRPLPVQPSPLLLGGLDLVAQRHEVLLRGVDALLEGARLRRGRGGFGLGLGDGRAEGGEAGLHLLVPRRHLLDLAPRGEEPLDVAAALDEGPPEGLAFQGHHRDRPLAGGDVERVLERRHHEGVGQGSPDALGVLSAHAVEVGQQAERLLLLGRDLAERPAVVACAGGGEGQEGPAAGPRGLQPADPAPRLLGVGHEHGLQAVPEEGLDRALVVGAGLERVGHDAEHLEALRPAEERPHPLVEGGVGGHHLLEGGAAAGHGGDLALQRRGVRERASARARASSARAGGVVARALHLGELPLGFPGAGVGRLPRRPDAPALALELLELAAQLGEVGRGAIGVPGHRGPRVLERGDAAEERHLGLAPPLLLGLRAGEEGRVLGDRRLGRAHLGLRRGEPLAQALLLGAPAGQSLGERRDPRDELLLLASGLLGAALVLGELLPCSRRRGPGAGPRPGSAPEAAAAPPRAAPPPRRGRAAGPRAGPPRCRGRRSPRSRAPPRPGAAPRGPASARGGRGSAGRKHALDPPHLFLDRAPAPRLRGLALQALELLLHLVDDVVDAEQVLLGGLELQLRLPAVGPCTS